eukprot:11226783-Lingulodinium_polyedra.AAC.1
MQRWCPPRSKPLSPRRPGVVARSLFPWARAPPDWPRGGSVGARRPPQFLEAEQGGFAEVGQEARPPGPP